ncbi:MAG: Gfo/Idh/MocA family protein [Propioniciclava sp.]
MIQLATIGTSIITGHLIDAVGEVPGITLAGVFSRDAARAATYATQYGATQSWSQLTELWSATSVDAVYIASPNALHAEQAHAALSAGKHVLVEKPATTNPADWDDLVAVARDRGLVIMEAMRSIHDPGMAAVRSWLPRLGRIRRASFGYAQRSSRYDHVLAGQQVNIFDPALGGGALMDLGVYPVSAMVQLFGVPSSVTGARVPISSGTDGAGAAVATYPGLVADISWSKITASSRECEIAGELGTLTYTHVTAPRRLTLTLLDGTTETQVVTAPEWNLRFEVARFVDAIAGADISVDQHYTQTTLRILGDLSTTAPGSS